MTIARKLLIDDTRSGVYHLVSRCVRRCFLAGDGYAHRRDWIAGLVEEMASLFTVDILSLAVMSNHWHAVIRTYPDQAVALSDLEVAKRWTTVFPKRDKDGNPKPLEEKALQQLAANPVWIHTQRKRLGSLSWFMKIVNERVAKKANKEDNCTGHFWEGRFTSVPLLDQGAVIAAMVYVDLNPIRAKIATTPENSVYTAVRERIAARQHYRKACGLEERAPKIASDILRRLAQNGNAIPKYEEDGLWIARMHDCIASEDDRSRALTPDDYIQLVDATGRIVKSGKRGAIPDHLKPILERLQIDVDNWISTMLSVGQFIGTAIGNAAARAKEALRRGCKWIIERTKIYRPDQQLQT